MFVSNYAQNGLQVNVDIAMYIMASGKINASGPKIPINSNWNLRLFRFLCTSMSDQEVATYLQFGWPLNRDYGLVEQTFSNHMMAKKYPMQVWKYLKKEKRMGTLLGPFVTSPFPPECTGVSPMSTRPKKGQENECHVIVDLSWGYSVNSLIPKDTYMGNPMKIVLPQWTKSVFEQCK